MLFLKLNRSGGIRVEYEPDRVQTEQKLEGRSEMQWQRSQAREAVGDEGNPYSVANNHLVWTFPWAGTPTTFHAPVTGLPSAAIMFVCRFSK